jgi:hypothetical protein
MLLRKDLNISERLVNADAGPWPKPTCEERRSISAFGGLTDFQLEKDISGFDPKLKSLIGVRL